MLTEIKGTGLGLTITRQYLELMGGTIVVESTPGKGSVFRFELPVQPVSVEALSRAEPVYGSIIRLEPGQPAYRILIVEDQVENRLLLRKILEPVGFEVREATTGAEAICLFQDWHPQLIWMDWHIPGMDGLEATRRIRSLEGGQETVIVTLTASAFHEQRDEALAAGADDFLSKPFREAEIFEAIRKHLGVVYVYAEGERQEAQGARLTAEEVLTPEVLAELPSELVSALEQATAQLNIQQVDQAIEALRAHHAGIAEALAALAKDFKYKDIWNMLQKTRNLSK